MEELQEADVLWPETSPPPPPWRDQEHYHYPPAPELYEASAVSFSYCVSFGSEPAASSSSSTSSAVLSGSSSDGFLSDPSTAAGRDDDDGDVAAEEFQEADVLWPDDVDVDAAREREVHGGELWWLCCGFGDAAGRRAEAAAAGKREASRPASVSSPIDIPTGAGAAARRRRRPTVVPVDRR